MNFDKAYNHMVDSNDETPIVKNICSDWTKSNGVYKQGYIRSPYQHLVELFGEPMVLDGSKVQVEWILEFNDGTIATIYDWKHYGMDYKDITEWFVGGFSTIAAEKVQAMI